MTLRLKAFLLIVLVLSALAAVLYKGADTVLSSSFSRLEQKEAQESLLRVKNIIQGDLVVLGSQVGDWASWDDAYDFVANGNQQFINKNILTASFVEIKTNLILFVNNSGSIVYEGWFDRKTNQISGGKVSMHRHLGPESRLLNLSYPSSSVTGIINLPEGPFMVAARPIVTTKRDAPIRGTLIMGRFIDSLEIDRLAKDARLLFNVYRVGDPYLTPELAAVQSDLAVKGAPLVKITGEHDLAVYDYLNDLYGKPSFIVKVIVPRQVMAEGEKAVGSYKLVIGVAVTVSVLLLGLLMSLFCFSRVLTLEKKSVLAWNRGELGDDLHLSSDDECGRIAATINEMLKSLRLFHQEAGNQDKELYRRFFEDAPGGFYVIDADGMLVKCNAAFARALGFDTVDAAISAKNIQLSPDDADRRSSLFASLSPGKQLVGKEVDFSCRFDKRLPTVQNLAGIFTPDGRLLQIEGSLLSSGDPVDPPREEVAEVAAAEDPDSPDLNDSENEVPVEPEEITESEETAESPDNLKP
jgi:sensor domain CHASE-containing protein